MKKQPYVPSKSNPESSLNFVSVIIGIFIGITLTASIIGISIAYDMYHELVKLDSQVSNLKLQLQYTTPRKDPYTMYDESGDKKSIAHGYLGAAVFTVSPEVAEEYHVPQGVTIYKVASGGAADKANLKQGDIIVAINGKSISTQEELIKHIKSCSAGDKVTLRVYKVNDANEYDLSVVVVTLQ